MNKPQSERNNTRQIHIWQFVDNWRQLQSEVINRLPKKLRADMTERVGISGESRIADSRIEDMAPIAKKQHSPTTKKATKIVVAIIGTLTFSAGTQVLTSRLGAAALPAAMLGGGLATFLVDDRATKTITKMRITHSTKQELQAIARQQQAHPPVNELDERFYSLQTALVQQVEGRNLEKQLLIDAVLAVSMSAAELTINLWIISQMGLPGGFLIEAIAASLPITIIWMAAAFQSDRFELPEHYADLMHKYESYLFPPSGMPEAEVTELLADKEAQESRIDWLVKFVADGDDGGRLKNLAMAEADYDLNLARKEKQQLEEDRNCAIEQRLFQHRAEVAELPNQFRASKTDITGWSPQQMRENKQRLERLRVQWVQHKTAELEATQAQDIQLIIPHRYSTKIQQREEDMAEAQKRYEEGRDNWSEENEGAEGDLGDAA